MSVRYLNRDENPEVGARTIASGGGRLRLSVGSGRGRRGIGVSIIVADENVGVLRASGLVLDLESRCMRRVLSAMALNVGCCNADRDGKQGSNRRKAGCESRDPHDGKASHREGDVSQERPST